jgi:uncharacterized alkaline shock family protein YloU
MNIFLRVLLTIYAFCLAILSLFTMSLVFKNDYLNSLYDFLRHDVLESKNASIAMFLIALVFFGISILFLFSGYGNNKEKKGVSKFTNIGEIKISLNSIENIALAASRKLIGVKETKANVIQSSGSVSIIIKAVVLPDINIPTLSEDIQVKVKSSVEESAGIKVHEVKVMVENIYTGYKARVE